MNGQENEKSTIVNPEGKWFFGVEMGTNTITSFGLDEPNKSLQAGILAEFYTGRHWSLTGRIKYFKTGLSDFKSSSGNSGFLGFGSESRMIYFEGKVLTIPINIKWEFRIWKNLGGNLNFGVNYNFETKSNYFSTNIDDYNRYSDKQYFSYNSGFGLNYFINNKYAVFANFEGYVGGKKGQTNSFLFDVPIKNTNTFVNFGLKYNFKK